MAFFEFEVNALSLIPALVAGAARQVGWRADETASGVYFTSPNYQGTGQEGGAQFVLNATAASAVDHRLTARLSKDANLFGSIANMQSPVRANADDYRQFARLDPTKLYVISMLEPEPFIAIVVEYGYNQFRHLYLGNMERIGQYGGGEVISACNGPNAIRNPNVTSGTYYTAGNNSCYLFSANQQLWSIASSGGVNIESAENAVPFRVFRDKGKPTQGVSANCDGTMAFGGFADNYNDAYVQKGLSSIAGATVFTPCNLVLDRIGSEGVNFIPIGHPSGVRMVNLANSDAQYTTEIGTERWHVFAALRRRNDIRHTYQNINQSRWPVEETSYYLGYAYRSE